MKDQLPLAGLTEVAILGGVTKSAIDNWIQRYDDFPQPVAKLACGPIWWIPSIEEWLKSHNRPGQRRIRHG